MTGFDSISSGIPEMDTALGGIRPGDSVVFRITEPEEFRAFVTPFIAQAQRDRRRIVYLRYADTEPLTGYFTDVKRVLIPLSHRFEMFAADIHGVIEQEGRGTFFIFDCLSELQAAWATDLMMGNFFKVTAPFLHSLGCVSYFPVRRGKHSIGSMNKILATAQIFLDVYSDKRSFYVRPEKVHDRSTDTMFLPHTYEPSTGAYRPILDGVKASRFYYTMGNAQRASDERYIDSWDRFFNHVKRRYRHGEDVTEECGRMCNIIMSRDGKMRDMIKRNFTPEDYFAVRDHMIGTGMIGGKACGMLLARAMIRNSEPDIAEVIEPHDSFYVGSDVYYTYIVDNGFWELRVKQRTDEGYFALADEFAQRLLNGSFSDTMREQFSHMIEYYGNDPYIVRSSSILEDGFGNAFAGKYESVFCPNRGTPEERLSELEAAIKTVYASSMSLSALDYRKRRGLDKRDEQMALLVQRVSGSYFGDCYMPCAAGVGYSYSPYRILPSSDPSAGMLRLVMGLGTSAVDRKEGSYPRIVSLDMPTRTTHTSSADRHRFSQGNAEVVNVTARKIEQLPLRVIEPLLPKYVGDLLLEHDFDAESRLREMGRRQDVRFISCKGIVENKELMERMRRLMQCVQREYGSPVDIEFTINISDNGEYSIDLLQCRPLQVMNSSGGTLIPDDIPREDILLESVGASMGVSRTEKLDIIVYVDPVKYCEMPYNRKNAVASLVGKINRHFWKKGKRMMLIVPGRVGTSSPELGVPTAFADISEFNVICEVEERGAGYNPELSYGSHIFQDLVEAGILYTAVFRNEKTLCYAPERLEGCPELTERFDGSGELAGIVRVYDVSGRDCTVYNDVTSGHLLIT